MALIGRRRGAVVAPAMPNGRPLRIRVVDITRGREPLREAA
jgi:hypothetical protein